MITTIERCACPHVANAEWQDITLWVTQGNSLSLRGDKELDSGTITFITTEQQPYPALAGYKITFAEGANTEVSYWVGFEDRTKLADNRWKCTALLTEVSKMAGAYLLDGLCNTQPLKMANYVLMDTLRRLVAHVPDGQDVPTFKLMLTDNALVNMLHAVTTPEFKFGPQTTLWEALIAIGDCVGALPRIGFGSVDSLYTVDYRFVTKSAAVSATLGTGDDVVADGITLDKEHYNSNLSMLAENLIEE